MGGGNISAIIPRPSAAGLSPRGRGKPLAVAFAIEGIGSIPAWAGETARHIQARYCVRVYPRVGGGNFGEAIIARRDGGLSPRGRGKPCRRLPIVMSARSIPAWAGETSTISSAASAGKVYPRVGGGNYELAPLLRHPEGLSPRGRGKQKRAHEA